MRIVTLGSGTGQATLLRGLCQYPYEITAIVGVTDNGGHSGQLRRLLRIPQVGDTRQCMSALFEAESVWGRLLSHRFTQGALRGLNVGNIMLAALTSQYGSFQQAVTAFQQATGLRQRILPVSDDDTQIGAELADGRCVIGEWEIIQRRPRTAITRLFLPVASAAHPAVLEALRAADLLVICPGSLLTGTISALLHAGVSEAIAASKATSVYVCNLMTQPGQTDGYTASQHLKTLHQYLPRHIDRIVLNEGPIPTDLVSLYADHESFPVVNDFSEIDVPWMVADLVDHPDDETILSYRRPQSSDMHVGLHFIRHDATKLTNLVLSFASCTLK